MELGKITSILKGANAQMLRDGSRAEIWTPRKIPLATRKVLREAFRDLKVTFRVGVKPQVVQTLAQVGVTMRTNQRHISLENTNQIGNPQEAWDAFCSILKQDGFATSWSWGEEYRYARTEAPRVAHVIDEIDIALLKKGLEGDDLIESLIAEAKGR